jgi:hypothetical protein
MGSLQLQYFGIIAFSFKMYLHNSYTFGHKLNVKHFQETRPFMEPEFSSPCSQVNKHYLSRQIKPNRVRSAAFCQIPSRNYIRLIHYHVTVILRCGTRPLTGLYQHAMKQQCPPDSSRNVPRSCSAGIQTHPQYAHC